jgi:hypothetical protein
MATALRYPTLYQINTRVWLNRLSREAGKRVTLADIEDATLDGFAEQGFDWIWLLSVWQIGPAGGGGFAQQPAMARRISGASARPDRGGYLRLWFCDHRIHRQ